LDVAKQFLIDNLPREAKELRALAQTKGIPGRTLKVAMIKLQVQVSYVGQVGRQKCYWHLAGQKLPAAEAAQVNAVMSDAAASDDSDLRAIVHCGTPLTATALAMAERTGASGRDVLAAMVAGYEAAGRISGPVSPQFRERGHHGSTMAIFVAAVAAGKLLKLDVERLTQTIALAATSASGLVKAADTSVAREYHAGLAVRSGIDAALAAERGFIAEESVLEGPTAS